MSEKVALITGASRGIGKEVAKLLAKNKAHVIITGRTIGALEELHDQINDLGGNATIVQMDLNDFIAIEKLSKAILERWGKLDILVANAAYLHDLTPLSHLNIDEWQKSININLSSTWFFIKNFEHLLINSKEGRAVFITSGAAHGERPFWGAYAVSKAAVESLARVWAGEIKETNLKVNLFDPGGTNTKMRAKAYPGENKNKLNNPKDVANKILQLCDENFQKNGLRFNFKDLS